ncbi:O-acyltransferase like protein-like isoform X1 [Anoplophora glabripennis]|uniref:O-acyltransferase like protein-like isoform X1 n=1 Tax=Anoplophora glabripennis TaxID=217634 RepID=UPI0008742F54|nr:O-acyltransferase like protein-like isoform X1 [Anoplophora glabripennis]
MDTMLFTFIILLYFSFVSSDKYNILPPIYEMEDYLECFERNDSYCKVDARLTNNGYENNSLWKSINDSIKDRNSYDRTIIHRAICLPKREVNLNSTKKFSELHINEKFIGNNLTASVENVFCITKDIINISLYDKLILFSFVAYLLLILYATMYDTWKRTSTVESTKDKVITALSLTSNWRKVCNTEGNEDHIKLKSIQGIRFYNMLLVISLHTHLSFYIVYISNPQDIEILFNTSIMQTLATMSVFFVQTFFMISSWIVTFQIYNIYKSHGKFTINQALILIFNRFFRIGVCSTAMLIFLKSTWNNLARGPINFDGIEMIQKACKLNWWQSFFLINNYLHIGEICHPISWYLSVDFQLYIMTTITIYLILKFKLNEFKIISFLIFFSCLLYGSIIYIKGMDIIYRINPNVTRMFLFIRSESCRVLYLSTYSNWTTSLVGMSLGIAYMKSKNNSVKNQKVISILWFLIFFGLPSAVIFFARHEFRGIRAAILGALVKPLFSLGIGIGILGMSHNMGGIIKHICENKYAVLMSNFSFCTYVFQIYVIFSKGIKSYSLMQFTLINTIKYNLFFDAPLAIIVGIISKLVFEQPGINLQKLFLPQIASKKEQLKRE